MATKMIAPAGVGGSVQGTGGVSYTVASDGTISNVNQLDILPLIRAGWRLFSTVSDKVSISSPLAADLVSVSAAAVATNRALTIAAQPAHARKLQLRFVIVTAITAGILTIIGQDQDGNAITEVQTMVASVTATVKSNNAYSSITSATISGLVGGGDGTFGIGLSNDFGLPTSFGAVDLTMIKSTKITKILGTSNIAVDDVASTGTLDATARTFAPTTVPVASGLVDYEFTYNYGLAA